MVRVFTGTADSLRHIAEFWQEESVKDFGMTIDIEEHLDDLQEMIDADNKDLLVIGDPPYGYMGIGTFKNPLGTELMANEHYWYIIPEKRRGMGAIRLMKAAQEWAISKGCSHLLMTASKLASGLHDNVCKLYERTGFSHFETTYIKRIQ